MAKYVVEHEIDDPDLELVARAKAGDYRSFDKLVCKYQYKTFSVVSGYIYDPGEAQDIVQEIFIKAWNRLSSFTGESKFRTWLWKISRNSALNYLRDHKHRMTIGGLTLDIDDDKSILAAFFHEEGPDVIIEVEELTTCLSDAVDSFTPEDRQMFIWRYIELQELGYIAKRIGLPVSSTSKCLKKIETRLRNTVDRYNGGGT